MKAVGLYRYLPIDQAEALVDVEIPKPEATGRDLLVKVEAISVNPVDTKVRAPKDTRRESAARARLGRRGHGGRGRAGRHAVQGRRSGVLCGQHHAAGREQRVPSGR